MSRPLRKDVPIELTWDLTTLFPSDTVWSDALSQISTQLSAVTRYQGQLANGSKVLLSCLESLEQLQIQLTQVATYAQLRFSEDGSNSANQILSARVAGVAAQVNAEVSFIKDEILALPTDMVNRYLNQEPELQDFAKFLQDLLETKPHQLTPETERTLAALGEVHSAPYTIYQRSKSSDMQFAPVKDATGQEHSVSFALYEDHFEFSSDTPLRRAAYASFTDTLQHYQNTFAATYATEVKKQVTLARLRHYRSATEMLLEPQQVTLEMYHNLLDGIQAELAPHMRRLARLRQHVLGLKEMRFCDLKVPLDPDFNPTTTYTEASQIILEALAVLGPEYGQTIHQALTERWVDLADNVGKSTGAFCSSPYGRHPFILITWTHTMRSAFVLAHELGHAGHFTLAQRHQRAMNSRPSMYFIEAPSTMHERLLAQHLLRTTTDPRMRRWVIAQSLGTYYHNYVTHLLEAELQRRVYTLAEQDTPITASLLNELKGTVLRDFWGDTVVIDDGARLTWMRQPHYYMGLYPYTYSAGLTLSTVVAQKIETNGQSAVDRWLKTLSAGGTQRPLELMRMAGVDMSTPEPIHQAVAYVGSLVDELEQSF